MLKLNYMGQTLGNRLLHVIIPKKDYGANKEQKPVFEGVMEQWADDALRLQRDGFRDRQNRLWRLAFIGNLAGWPQQAKTGCLQRSFLNVSKKASAKKRAKGICHVCPAGQDGYPFEFMSMSSP